MSLDEQTAAEALRRMAGGFAATQMLVAAAELRITDHLGGRRRLAEDLAAEIGVSASSLYRFLRMLVVLDLLEQFPDGSFGLQPMGELLRSDHPQSQRDLIVYIGAVGYRAALGTLHSVKTGTPAVDHILGKPFFEIFADDPVLGSIFNGLMEQAIRPRIEGVVATFDFGPYTTIVDVGGGNGSLLKAILQANPSLTGILFDLPKVVEQAKTKLREDGFADRIETTAGDFFFDQIPGGATLYVLSNIIHDWDDERSLLILKNCSNAMRADSELLVIADVMPDRVGDARATVATDFSMMLLTGGQERTVEEHDGLFRRASLRLDRIVPIPTRQDSRDGRGSSATILVARKTVEPLSTA